MSNALLEQRRRQWMHRKAAILPRLIARDATPEGWVSCAYCSTPLAHQTLTETTQECPPERGGGYICVPGYEWLQVDHTIPLAQGGTDDLDNLVLCCGPCNARKGAR